MSIICPNCNSVQDDEANYCHNCGTQLKDNLTKHSNLHKFHLLGVIANGLSVLFLILLFFVPCLTLNTELIKQYSGIDLGGLVTFSNLDLLYTIDSLTLLISGTVSDIGLSEGTLRIIYTLLLGQPTIFICIGFIFTIIKLVRAIIYLKNNLNKIVRTSKWITFIFIVFLIAGLPGFIISLFANIPLSKFTYFGIFVFLIGLTIFVMKIILKNKIKTLKNRH